MKAATAMGPSGLGALVVRSLPCLQIPTASTCRVRRLRRVRRASRFVAAVGNDAALCGVAPRGHCGGHSLWLPHWSKCRATLPR